MAAHSFFVDPQSIQGGRAELRGQVVHRIGRVLRLHPGDEIDLLDNSGFAYSARIVRVTRESVSAEVLGRWRPATEPRVELALYQALLKGQKMEMVLQKGTEIGVSIFVPVLSERCVSRPSAADLERRLGRWGDIVREAAEQSKRAVLPRVASLCSFEDACREAREADLAAMAWEEEPSQGLGTLVRETGVATLAGREPATRPRVALLVGPEGGFSEREAQVAGGAGLRIASLGPRILRAETAALVAATVVLCETGDLGG